MMKRSIFTVIKCSDGTIRRRERKEEGEPLIAGRSARLAVTAFCLTLSLAACGETKGERALSGAGIGAGVGAAGSAVTGGSPWTGAVIGGAVGAATGALTDEGQIDLDD